MLNNKISKKLAAVFLIGSMSLAALTGCSTNGYEALVAAQEKTDLAATGINEIKIQLDNELNTQSMTPEQLKSVNYFKSVAYEGTSQYDNNADVVVSDSWISLGGVGFDFTYYGKGEEQYIRYPVLKKYIDLNQMAKSQASKGTSFPKLTAETQKALGDIWNKLSTKETVQKVEETVVTTPEGDVKATHYDVVTSGDAVKAAILESQKILLADSAVTAWLEEQQAKNPEGHIEIAGVKEDMEIGDFKLSSYVDADGYLIREEVKVSLKSGPSTEAYWLGTDFTMTSSYSKLNQKLDIQFPNISPDQVMTEEELNKDMPAVFSDVIK